MGGGMIELLSKWPARGPLYRHGAMRAIAEEHAEAAGVTLDDLRGPCRARRYFAPRQAAMAEIQATGQYSYPQIGRFFNRDHTSVLTAVQRYRALAKQGVSEREAA
jgi:chromosomal replication initiation ATPase DnaA